MLFLKGQKKTKKRLDNASQIRYTNAAKCGIIAVKKKTLQVVLLCRRKNRYLS